MVVPRAFIGAELADVGAESAELRGVIGIACHERGRQPAEIGTVAIQTNAAGKKGDIILAQTGRRALLACRGACAAGVDTGTIGFIDHRNLSLD